MSPLRLGLKRPETYLLGLAMLLGAAGLDTLRSPGKQVTADLYIAAVGGYRRWGRPLLESAVRCRYRPTCSAYSIEAVERYGLRRGLALTWRRVAACRGPVPPGTSDPVEVAGEGSR